MLYFYDSVVLVYILQLFAMVTKRKIIYLFNSLIFLVQFFALKLLPWNKQAWKSFSELWSRKAKLINLFIQYVSALLRLAQNATKCNIQIAGYKVLFWVTQQWLSIVSALLSTKNESEWLLLQHLLYKIFPMNHFSGRLSSDSAVLSSENLHKHSLNQVLLESAKKFGILQTV